MKSIKSWFTWKSTNARVAVDLGSHSLKWAVVSEGREILRHGSATLIEGREQRDESPTEEQIRIDLLRQHFDGAGLMMETIELPALALTREFHANHPEKSERKLGLLHTGFSLNQMVGLIGPHPYFARDFTLGTRDFIGHLRVGQHWSWSSAANRLTFENAMVRGPTEPALWRLEREVERTLAYFPFKPEALFLSGRGLPVALESRLSNYLKMPVTLDRPSCLEWPEDPVKSMNFKLAVGLAL